MREATTGEDKLGGRHRGAHAALRDMRAAPLRHLHQIFPHGRAAKISGERRRRVIY